MHLLPSQRGQPVFRLDRNQALSLGRALLNSGCRVSYPLGVDFDGYIESHETREDYAGVPIVLPLGEAQETAGKLGELLDHPQLAFHTFKQCVRVKRFQGTFTAWKDHVRRFQEFVATSKGFQLHE